MCTNKPVEVWTRVVLCGAHSLFIEASLDQRALHADGVVGERLDGLLQRDQRDVQLVGAALLRRQRQHRLRLRTQRNLATTRLLFLSIENNLIRTNNLETNSFVCA